MSKGKILKLAGQQSFAFGSRGDPAFAERSCEVTVMTPRLSARLMQGTETDGMNAATYRELVSIYGTAMKALWWMLTGETVVVDRNGRVIDGRARLQACIESNMPFPVVLVTGIDPEAEYAIDTRKTRSMADTVHVQGESRPQSVVHACEMIVGFLHAKNRAVFVAGGKEHGLDNHRIARLLSRYPNIAAAARSVDNLDLPGFPHSVLTAARFLMGLLDEEKASAFFAELGQPDPTGKGIPSRLARKAKVKLTDRKPTKALAILAQCWMAYVADDKFHSRLLAYDGRVEGALDGLQGFPDWGLTAVDRLVFDAVDPPISIPWEIANGGPDMVETYLRERLKSLPVRARFFDLTPEWGRKFLASGGPNGMGNRKVSLSHLAEIKADIMGGRWHSTGQSVKISRYDFLLDGQHRCRAVVETGKSIEVVLVEGLNDRVFPVLDGGIRKSFIHKERSKSVYVGERNAALVVLIKIEANDEKALDTPTLVRATSKRHPNLLDGILSTKAQTLVPPSVAAALCSIFLDIDRDVAMDFFGKIASGADLKENEPVYVLREKLLRSGRDKSHKTHARHARWVIHAWNATIEGRPLTRIKDTKGPGFPAISKG